MAYKEKKYKGQTHIWHRVIEAIQAGLHISELLLHINGFWYYCPFQVATQYLHCNHLPVKYAMGQITSFDQDQLCCVSENNMELQRKASRTPNLSGWFYSEHKQLAMSEMQALYTRQNRWNWDTKISLSDPNWKFFWIKSVLQEIWMWQQNQSLILVPSLVVLRQMIPKSRSLTTVHRGICWHSGHSRRAGKAGFKGKGSNCISYSWTKIFIQYWRDCTQNSSLVTDTYYSGLGTSETLHSTRNI